jgi:hypothetical protein
MQDVGGEALKQHKQQILGPGKSLSPKILPLSYPAPAINLVRSARIAIAKRLQILSYLYIHTGDPFSALSLVKYHTHN